MRNFRRSRRGFTLIEVAVATIVVVITTIVGAAFYAESRIQEIKEWHEQNGLFLAEREVESWQGAGYNALAGWASTDVTSATSPSSNVFLPYGYAFAFPDANWNQALRFKPVALDGFNYRIRAQQLYTHSSPSTNPDDFYVQDTWNNGAGNVVSRYRIVRVVVQWGTFSGFGSSDRLVQETRVAR